MLLPWMRAQLCRRSWNQSFPSQKFKQVGNACADRIPGRGFSGLDGCQKLNHQHLYQPHLQLQLASKRWIQTSKSSRSNWLQGPRDPYNSQPVRNQPTFSRNGTDSEYIHFKSKPSYWTRKRKIIVVVSSTAVVVYYVSHLERAPYTGRVRMIDVGPAQEAQIGLAEFNAIKSQFSGSVLSYYHPYTQLVRKVGQRIAKVCDEPDFQWEFIVIDTADINAFCLPGGKVAVFSGLLQKVVRDEDELACIMAHEIGHAVAHHGAEKMGFMKILLIAQLAMSLVFDMRFITDPLLLFLGNLPFSRKLEYEADRIGLILMREACYDVHASPRVFSKMGKIAAESGRVMPKYLSTHPADEDRVEYIKSLIPDIEKKYGKSCRRGWFD